jgi:hypothetical protein
LQHFPVPFLVQNEAVLVPEDELPRVYEQGDLVQLNTRGRFHQVLFEILQQTVVLVPFFREQHLYYLPDLHVLIQALTLKVIQLQYYHQPRLTHETTLTHF